MLLIRIGRSIRSMHDSEAGVIGKIGGFLTMGWSTESMCLSQRGERALAQELARTH